MENAFFPEDDCLVERLNWVFLIYDSGSLVVWTILLDESTFLYKNLLIYTRISKVNCRTGQRPCRAGSRGSRPVQGHPLWLEWSMPKSSASHSDILYCHTSLTKKRQTNVCDFFSWFLNPSKLHFAILNWPASAFTCEGEGFLMLLVMEPSPSLELNTATTDLYIILSQTLVSKSLK